MTGILKGMRVVEGSAFVAVPLAGMTLAQMGADVIRFDRIGGGLDAQRWPVAPNGDSLFWAGMNKGKRSIAVDLKRPEGRELITRIVTAPGEDAGMVITNLRVRGWMDYPTLGALRPDLIMVTLTGERHRLWIGQGQDVELALKDVAAAMLGNLGMIGEATVTGKPRPKAGNALYGAYGQDFACADGRRVMVIGLTERQWAGIVEQTGTAQAMAALEARTGLSLAEEGSRWKLRHEITAILRPWFAARRVADFAADFERAGLTWSEFRSLPQALAEDPDLSEANPMFRMLEHPGVGAYPVPGSPITFSAARRQDAVPAPALGQHTEEILGDVVGLDDREIGALFDRGVVASPRWQAGRSAA